VVLSDTAPLTELPPMIPAGVPASVLERRPDIAAAQNQLAAANAGIGAARAAFFPSISLTGNAGYAAQDMGNLFKSSTSTWAYGPTLTLPIFQGATNINNLRKSKGVYEEAVANYRQQVLSAFADVDNALAAHRISIEQASGQMRAAQEIGRTADQSQRQLELGDIAMADYNNSRQQALVARINAQNALLTAYTESAQLVRALGGSWDVPSVTTISAAAK
jgi:multidrug efflux system outer membrane protein